MKGNTFAAGLRGPHLKRTVNLLPPLLRQLAGGGGGEDGMTEAFEDGGHAVEASRQSSTRARSASSLSAMRFCSCIGTELASER